MSRISGEGLLVALVVLAIFGLFALLYLDARAFAEDCLAAGGTVVSPKVCLP